MYNLFVSRMEFLFCLSFVCHHVLAHASLTSRTHNVVVMIGMPGTGQGGDGMGRDRIEKGRAVPSGKFPGIWGNTYYRRPVKWQHGWFVPLEQRPEAPFLLHATAHPNPVPTYIANT